MWLRVFFGCLWIGMAVTAWAGEYGNLVYSDQGTSITITGVVSSPTEPVVIPEEIDGKPVTAIGNSAFLGSTLNAVTIPESVTSIAWGAFLHCDHLVDLTIPGGVTSIGNYAFSDCKMLKQVTISEGAQTIGTLMFSYCENLEKVTLPEGLTSIGADAFNGCGNLGSVTLPESLVSIGGSAFAECVKLREVVIPGNVTSMGGAVFYNCVGLEKVLIKGGLTEIGMFTFNSCTSLKEISIPSSVTKINGYAFYQCSGLESVSIPGSVGVIGSNAFELCKRLRELELGDGVWNIERSAFEGCAGLIHLTIPASVRRIDSYAFGYCPMLSAAVFLGDAPAVETETFHSAGLGFLVRFYEGRKGFKAPFWNGYPAVMILVRPEIQVEQPLGTTVGEGQDRRWLGRQELGSRSEPMYFTIRNLGEERLTGMAVKVTGAHAKDFIVLGERKKLAGRESMKFRVIFKPRAEGLRQAMLRIRSDDADEPMIDVELQGEGRKKRSW